MPEKTVYFLTKRRKQKMTRSGRSHAGILVVFQAAATPIWTFFVKAEQYDKTSTDPGRIYIDDFAMQFC